MSAGAALSFGLPAITPLNADQRHDLMATADNRHDRASTIFTRQVLVELCHKLIGHPTIADAVLDQLVHGAYRLDRVTDPHPGPVANIKPTMDRSGTTTGWKLHPLLVMQGSKSKVWQTPA